MTAKEFGNYAQEIGCEVRYSEQLSKYTSFRIGGECKCMVLPENTENLSKLLAAAKKENVRTFVLGKGSNVLFDDEGFDGAVILIGRNFSGIQVQGEKIIAQSGETLSNLCKTALEHGLSGIEFAYGIPGTVGGGIYMNAGAYGGEIKDVIKSVRAVDSKDIHDYSADMLDMGYRHSRFCGSEEVITEGVFELRYAEKSAIENRMNELIKCRRDKQPLDFPSAGSTFKRPPGQFAGKLIQDCGLRGKSVGGAQVSEKHCGFVINTGGATSKDVRELIKLVQDTVLDKTGYFLECEVRIVDK